jgi:putative ABC transport system permease protein
MVPITYNLRNLIERKATTLMTALGIGLTVAILVVSLALTDGLRALFAASGDPRQAMVLRKGTNAELTSWVATPAFNIIRTKPGVAVDDAGKPLVSPEAFVVANFKTAFAPDGVNVSVRGIAPVGLTMHHAQITQGQMFQPGLHQVTVGESIALRYPDCQPGKKIVFGKSSWDVVGVFRAADQSANSEIWCDLNQLIGDYERPGGSSSVLVRLESPASFDAFKQNLEADRQLGVSVQKEKDYYASMTSSGLPLEILGLSVAAIMAIGSAFAATNTMYAAVARRSREIGTLRALGFGRAAILLSFITESVCLSLLGGILGVFLALPIDGLATGVGNFSTFTDVTFKFRVSTSAMMWGLAFAAIIGAIGGFLPAYAASKKDIVQAMRDS